MEFADDGIRFDATSTNVEEVREADKYQGVKVSLLIRPAEV
jgi:hypothetical protein